MSKVIFCIFKYILVYNIPSQPSINLDIKDDEEEEREEPIDNEVTVGQVDLEKVMIIYLRSNIFKALFYQLSLF